MIDQYQLFATYYIRVSLKLVFIAQNAKLFLAHLCSPLSFVYIKPTFSLCHAPKVVRHHAIFILPIRYRWQVISMQMIVTIVCVLYLLTTVLLTLHLHIPFPSLFVLCSSSIIFTNLFVNYLKLFIISMMFW